MIIQRSLSAYRQLARQSRTIAPLVGYRMRSATNNTIERTQPKLVLPSNSRDASAKLWPMGAIVITGIVGTGLVIAYRLDREKGTAGAAKISSIPHTTRKVLREIENSFHLSDEMLKAIGERFIADFRTGYSKYGEPMAMIPTFVTSVPNGTETGTFLAVDLGGTNLRVCEVKLLGNRLFKLRSEKFEVSNQLKTGTATDLFDYIADRVNAFIITSPHPNKDDDGVLSLGLTFSFPVEQTALDKGNILTWTKGFSATGAVGHDVVQLLQDAFDRKHVHVKCTALVNDTVGTLLAHAYTTGGCLLGAIFGTGTNGAFVEKLASFTKLGKSVSAAHSDIMVVNTEWGAFDNKRVVLPLTSFDNKLDRESINPRFQCFEKLISGMYLGEITRNILLHLIDNDMLFSGHSTSKLNQHYGLDSRIMSEVESDPSSDLSLVREILIKELEVDEKWINDSDLEIVRWACQCVGTRAAMLSGVAVAATIIQTKAQPPISIGIDGSLFEFYPHFEERLRKSLKVLVGHDLESKVKIGLARDGSGVGAALGALMANK